MPAPTTPLDVDALVSRHLDGVAVDAVSVWWGSPDGTTTYARDAEVPHYAASTMKLPLVVAAHRRHDRGELDLDAPVEVHDAFASAYDGATFSMRQEHDQDDETWDARGTSVPLRELARRAVVRSGNLATNLVLERTGTDEVAAVLRDAGCSPATVLPRGIEDAPAREAGLDNLVTAHDLGLVIGALVSGRLVGAGSARELEAVLAAQEHDEQVPAGLPAGTYVAHKTGWVDGVAHDVALVRPADRAPYVLAVCSTADAPEQTLYDLNAAVSRAVWEAQR
ncbi:MAG: serine hydrolase [Nocardioidaceae bacterium]|nr:serine hydrolase [Nocardioidaceae bacterium]NUS50126.1 serine hydrolase [Nocardioidaceae bacterium]